MNNAESVKSFQTVNQRRDNIFSEFIYFETAAVCNHAVKTDPEIIRNNSVVTVAVKTVRQQSCNTGMIEIFQFSGNSGFDSTATAVEFDNTVSAVCQINSAVQIRLSGISVHP